MMQFIREVLFGGRGAVTLVGDIGLLIGRIAIGLYMAIGHGYGKLFHEDGFGPTQQLIKGTAGMGFPMPTFFAWCAALAEFAGALMLAIGLLTRPAAAVLVFNMGVAAFVVHGSHPWAGGSPSKEPALLYLIPFLMFAFTGAGRLSIDRLFHRRTRDL